MNAGGLSRLVDVRHLLPANAEGGPGLRLALSEKRGVVVHYNGPPIAEERAALDVLRADAAYHVSKDWDEAPGNGVWVRGDGLMYHVAIARDGTRYLCRDLDAVLWHCGEWRRNREALSVLVLIGGDQHATKEQIWALREVCQEWMAAGHGSDVWGHQEISATSCPGSLMADFVYPYREGRLVGPVAYGHWFPETGHFVGGAFWEHWQAHGGLMVFGYPLTEELEEDGRVVQYFERAVFEWWPENDPPYRVLLRRLGAEALALKRA